MINNQKIVVVMPAYNADQTLAQTFQELPMDRVLPETDGPFATIDLIKSFKIENLEDGLFSKTIEMIQQISPKELQDLAIKYLDIKKWVVIVVK